MSGPARRYLPIIKIVSPLNQLRVKSLRQQIQSLKKMNPVALAIIVDVPSQMAVQADKVVSSLLSLKKELNLPIYGFTDNKCTAHSYYILSAASQIYSDPTTTFHFKNQIRYFPYSSILDKFGIKTITAFSNKLMEKFMAGSITTSNIYGHASKQTNICHRLFKYSIQNRNNSNQGKTLQTVQQTNVQNLAPVMLGREMHERGLIDGFGYVKSVLKSKHPDAKLDEFNTKQFLGILKIIAIISSPILVCLFLLKVWVKWSIIIYAWIKAKAKEVGVDLDDDETVTNKK